MSADARSKHSKKHKGKSKSSKNLKKKEKITPPSSSSSHHKKTHHEGRTLRRTKSLFVKKKHVKRTVVTKSGKNKPPIPPLIVPTLQHLPEQYKRLLEEHGVPILEAAKHYTVVLNILHFLSRRTFLLNRKNSGKSGVNKGQTDRLLRSKEDELLNKNDPTRLFKSHRYQGKGAFGTVEVAKHIRTKAIIAIKKVPHVTQKNRMANIREIEFLKKLKGTPSIVKYYASYRHEDEIWMIMEFMEGGTLEQAISKWEFNEAQVAYVARKILEGLRKLHELNYVHRDIKPSNIMMSIYGDAKIIDFGLCVDLNQEVEPRLVGSPFWMSPEMIKQEKPTPVIDIWSFGIIICQLFDKHYIKKSASHIEVMWQTATKGPKPFKGKQLSTHATDFITTCLKVDPTQRAKAAELIEHPFVKSMASEEEMVQILKVIYLNTALDTQGFL